jgi:hypothetical protein
MRVELKRSDYTVPEMNLAIVDRSFKVKRVTRQPDPAASRSNYQVGSYAMSEVHDYLFATRTNRVTVSDNVRAAGRKLITDYLKTTHPAAFTEDQILYLSPMSPVCNDVWVSGRATRIILFRQTWISANLVYTAQPTAKEVVTWTRMSWPRRRRSRAATRS